MEFEAFVPARRWCEAAVWVPAACDVVGQLVVRSALFGVGQDILGLVNLSHACLGISLFADIGVVLASQLSVGLANVVFACTASDAKRAVVVLEVHGVEWLSGVCVARLSCEPLRRVRKNKSSSSREELAGGKAEAVRHSAFPSSSRIRC